MTTRYYIEDDFVSYVKQCDKFGSLSTEEHSRLYKEVKNVVLQGIGSKLIEMVGEGKKTANKVNSLLNWVIGLTDVYPEGAQKIKSDGSYPDYDLDFSKAKRDQVIDYTKAKYGEDRVIQVTTFGRLGAKAAVRSAARALGYTVADGDSIAKLISNEPGITLSASIEANEQLKAFVEKKVEPYAHIIRIALELEGLPNSTGCHASAICITDKPTHEYFPLMISKKDGNSILSQYDYYDIEANKVIKWDFLGLKTLDVIQKACELIKERHNVDIDIDTIDVNDPTIYALLNGGHNTGIFQFESDAGLKAIQSIKPENINELSDITSINRPGPISAGILSRYVQAKLKGEKYDYGMKSKALIEKMHEICSASYGLLIYQEQAIKIFTVIAGYDEIEGDNIRRSLGKKKQEIMDKNRAEFVSRGSANGYPESDLSQLYDQIEGFAAYCFNRTHAVCYSIITAQTAWLSANYPLEFYAALLTVDSGNPDDVRKYILGCKKREIVIEAPGINTSGIDFSIVNDKIVFGLSAIKGVGQGVSKKILTSRPKRGGYRSFGHFIDRNLTMLNKKILESYVKAGLFSDFGRSKNSYLISTENVLNFLSILKDIGDRYTIFDMLNIGIADYIDHNLVMESHVPDELFYEIEALGLYITGHPMDNCEIDWKKCSSIANVIEEVNELSDGEEEFKGSIRLVPGVISNIEIKKTKAKMNMALFMFSDSNDSMRCTMFPKAYSEMADRVKEGELVIIEGHSKDDISGPVFIVRKVFYSHEKPGIIAKIVKRLDDFSKETVVKINNLLSFKLVR